MKRYELQYYNNAFFLAGDGLLYRGIHHLHFNTGTIYQFWDCSPDSSRLYLPTAGIYTSPVHLCLP